MPLGWKVLIAAMPDVGLGVAWTHAMDRDARAGGSTRQRTSQPDFAVLGRAIGADVGVTDQARRAGDIDDGAPLVLQHVGQSRLHAMEGPTKVDLDHALPCVFVYAIEALAFRLPGLVDQEIGRASCRGRVCQYVSI